MWRILTVLFILLAAPLRAETQAVGGSRPETSLMDEAFLAAQAGFASSAGAALRQIGLRAAAGTGPLADLVRERQALAARLQAAEQALTAPEADRVELAGLADGLGAEIAALDARIATDFPRFDELTQPKPLSIAEVQALLRPDEALVLTWVGESYAFVWAISPTRAGWHRINAGRTTLDAPVEALRASIDQAYVTTRAAAPLGDAPADSGRGFARGVAAQLYDVLLRPLAPVIGPQAHLFVVADGPLTSLPFALLVTAAPTGANDDPQALRDTDWLIRRHALTTLPSVEGLRIVRNMPPPPERTAAFLGFGDPEFAPPDLAPPGAAAGEVAEPPMTLASATRGGVMRGGLADVDRLRALAPLPQTRRELELIARTLGADRSLLHLGRAASETMVRRADLRAAPVIAFATHGLLSGDLQGLDEPALVLTPPDEPTPFDDGLLTASEIIDLPLDADWVVLSACNTAGGDRPGAAGLSGLARAFLFAGARSILVSHWPVRDDAAARLTTGTFAHLAGGTARGRADALRRAMLDLMADRRDPTLAHPAAWAPFVLVGEGG